MKSPHACQLHITSLPRRFLLFSHAALLSVPETCRPPPHFRMCTLAAVPSFQDTFPLTLHGVSSNGSFPATICRLSHYCPGSMFHPPFSSLFPSSHSKDIHLSSLFWAVFPLDGRPRSGTKLCSSPYSQDTAECQHIVRAQKYLVTE